MKSPEVDLDSELEENLMIRSILVKEHVKEDLMQRKALFIRG